jgi:fructoselysine-6-P-deglycase FrlB-like protein
LATAQSPLAEAAAHVVPLRAGRETSIAATKTYTAEPRGLSKVTLTH